jgi:hydrogenase maturation factor
MLSSGTMLATVPAADVGRVVSQCESNGIPSAIIGKLTSPESGFHLIEGNRTVELPTFQTDEVTRALSTSA